MKWTLLAATLLIFGACAQKPSTFNGMAKVFNKKYEAAPHTDGARKPACTATKNKKCK